MAFFKKDLGIDLGTASILVYVNMTILNIIGRDFGAE